MRPFSITLQEIKFCLICPKTVSGLHKYNLNIEKYNSEPYSLRYHRKKMTKSFPINNTNHAAYLKLISFDEISDRSKMEGFSYFLLNYWGALVRGWSSTHGQYFYILPHHASPRLVVSKMLCPLNISFDVTSLPVANTPSEEKDILVCIITATQLSCDYTGTWLDRTSQG